MTCQNSYKLKAKEQSKYFYGLMSIYNLAKRCEQIPIGYTKYLKSVYKEHRDMSTIMNMTLHKVS